MEVTWTTGPGARRHRRAPGLPPGAAQGGVPADRMGPGHVPGPGLAAGMGGPEADPAA